MVTSPVEVDDNPPVRPLLYALLVFGLLMFGLGVFLIVDPNETLKVVTVVVGIFVLVDAVILLIAAIAGRGEGRGLLAIVGVITLLAGLLLVKKPFTALYLFVAIIGIWFVIAGVARFVYAFSERAGRLGNITIAVLDVIAGVVILSWPEPSLKTLAIIIGIVFALRGGLMVYAAWRLLRLESAERHSGTALAT